MTAYERMGWLRTAVGVAMIAAPGPTLRISDPEGATGTARLLLRTIGIRDLALGLGTVDAARGAHEDLRRWITLTMASDVLDVLASVAAVRAVGRRDATLAASLALAFVVKDVVLFRALPSAAGPTGPAPGRSAAGPH
jgi:hypothetical protein